LDEGVEEWLQRGDFPVDEWQQCARSSSHMATLKDALEAIEKRMEVLRRVDAGKSPVCLAYNDFSFCVDAFREYR
jgi:hypothetical protein